MGTSSLIKAEKGPPKTALLLFFFFFYFYDKEMIQLDLPFEEYLKDMRLNY